jgi:hypothetical protein
MSPATGVSDSCVRSWSDFLLSTVVRCC